MRLSANILQPATEIIPSGRFVHSLWGVRPQTLSECTGHTVGFVGSKAHSIYSAENLINGLSPKMARSCQWWTSQERGRGTSM